MPSTEVYREASDVFVEDGSVIVEGPDGVAVTWSPDAAEETARRLHAAAATARAQRGKAPAPPH
jgi:hypothetical protein